MTETVTIGLFPTFDGGYTYLNIGRLPRGWSALHHDFGGLYDGF